MCTRLGFTAAVLLSLAAYVTADEPPTPTTDEAPPTPSDQQPEQPERCEDSHSDCKGWVVSGECANNPSFMHAQCRRACGLCSASAAGVDELDWKTRLLERWQVLTLLLEGWRAGLTPPQQQLLSALTAAVVALVSAVLWVWWQRREQHVPTAATAAAGLGSADLSNVREQRLSTISRSHSKPSAAREAPPPADRPPVSPPAERPPAFWKRFVGSGGGGGGDGGGGGGNSSGGGGSDAATAAAGLGSADLSDLREQRLSTISRSHSKPSAAREAPPPADRPPVSPPAERPPAFWKRFVGSGGGGGGGGDGGGGGGNSSGGGGGSDGGGGGSGGGGGGSGGVRDSWLVHEQARQAAAAEAVAEQVAGGGGAAAAHWRSLFRGAEESEAALEAFAEGGRALLVAVEGSDPASLHLLRSVWPDAAVGRRLQGGISEAAVLALRVSGSAPQAAFWRAELALTSRTELWLLSGAHGAEPLRARSLAAATLAHSMDRAHAEARRAGAASCARGAALLARFRAWEARGFEPPPPAPPPPRPPSASQLLDQQGSEYAAALAQDEAIEAAEAAAVAEAVEAAEAAEAAEAVAAAAAAARQAAREARREARAAKAATLPDEPPGSSADAARVVVRMRDGRRLQRRFDRTCPLQTVVDWLQSEEPEGGDFTLVSNYPRKVFGEAHLPEALEELGLWPTCTLFTQELDDNDEDE